MNLDKDRALAVALLAEHRQHIAQSIVRFTRRLEPRWTAVPTSVAEASAAAQLRSVEEFLKTDDPEPLLTVIRDAARLRRHVGFEVGDFAVKSHAYLPVIRKVFMSTNRLPSESLRAYEVVESAMLPLMARLLKELAAAPAEITADELEDQTDTVPRNKKQVVSLNPFTMVDVEADLTDPGV
jgi:hypothetical protein